MAFCASDDTHFRLEQIGINEERYEKAVRAALQLQNTHTINFFELMDKELAGSKEFLYQCHKRFMKDFGKRNLVISRLNQDLDCVDIRDPDDPNQITNTKKLKEMYKLLCKF